MGRTFNGQIGSWNAQNIWDSSNSVQFSNTLCTNTYLWMFSPPGRPAGCGGSRAEGELDSTFNGDWSDLGEMNELENLAVGDVTNEIFDDPTFAAVGDVTDEIFDPGFFAVDDGQEFFDDVNAFEDPNFAVGDQDGSFLPFDRFDGEFNNAIEPDHNTNTNTNNNVAPTYAYVLFAIAVLLLIALIVVQVQLILIQRARAESRV